VGSGPPGSFRTEMHLNGFQFREFFDCKATLFPAQPAFRVAAEGKFGVAVHEGVHPNCTRSDAATDRQRRVESPASIPRLTARTRCCWLFRSLVGRIEGED
jgi:hypothetical protein